ncbi:polysaccharide biosynthesis C-terminal domain-containing protein [Candidatus Woesearchaeota archaeon]|nr:polysaccharide biosynthesis C-terminal domain-containing protein [Candidatus Woesearchaeota archaeon]
MADEKEIIHDTITFSILKYISFSLVIVSTAVLLKLLPVSVFGIYSALMLLLDYSRFGFLIPYSASFKKIPFLRGKNSSEKEIQEVRDLSFGPTFYIMLIGTIAIFTGTYFTSQFSYELVLGIRLTALLVMLQHFNFFQTNFLRTDKRFNLVGVLELVLVATRLVLIFALVGKYGLNGTLVAFIISYAITIALGIYLARYRFSFSLRTFNRKAWKLFLFGLPPALVGIIATAFVTVDKLMVIRFLDTTMLGYYSFAILVVEVISFVPNIIATVMLPRQLEKHGQKMNTKTRLNYLVMPQQIISYLIPFVIAAAFIFSELITLFFFPKYLNALPVIYILIFASFFLSNSYSIANYLLSVDKEKHIIIGRSILILFAIISNYTAIVLGYGICGVAIATLISYILEFLYLCIVSLKAVKASGKTRTKYLIRFIFPFIYMSILLYLSSLFQHETVKNIASVLVQTCKYAGFVIIYVPLLFYLEKNTGFISTMYEYTKTAIKKLTCNFR